MEEIFEIAYDDAGDLDVVMYIAARADAYNGSIDGVGAYLDGVRIGSAELDEDTARLILGPRAIKNACDHVADTYVRQLQDDGFSFSRYE